MSQEQEMGFLDKRKIDTYVFNGLVAKGFVPGFDEVQAVTNIFIALMVDMGIAFEQEVEVSEEEDEE